VATAFFLSYNGGLGIKADIIQINPWNRRTNQLACRVKLKSSGFPPSGMKFDIVTQWVRIKIDLNPT